MQYGFYVLAFLGGFLGAGGISGALVLQWVERNKSNATNFGWLSLLVIGLIACFGIGLLGGWAAVARMAMGRTDAPTGFAIAGGFSVLFIVLGRLHIRR